ncbi:hypothetical protein WA577_007548 [Blastocystis sp. JDR]
MFDVYSEVRQVLKEYPTISDSTSGYFLPKKLPTAPKYTIVLDLDGTLIYCTREERERYDATFTIPSVDEYTGEQVDLTLYLSFRPYVFEFLKEMSKLYEIIIFTASTPCYARKIVDFFNKDGIVIQHLLTREQTTYLSNGFHFKDLQRLNRDMKTTFIVDNRPDVFCYSVNNGVPISTWEGEEDDKELFSLIHFFRSLTKCQDVRPVIKETFQVENLLTSQSISL